METLKITSIDLRFTLVFLSDKDYTYGIEEEFKFRFSNGEFVSCIRRCCKYIDKKEFSLGTTDDHKYLINEFITFTQNSWISKKRKEFLKDSVDGCQSKIFRRDTWK